MEELRARSGVEIQYPSKRYFAIMYLESGFKPYAKNENSGAAGLGQFIPSTWKAFIEDNPEFAGKDQFDPRASFLLQPGIADKMSTIWV